MARCHCCLIFSPPLLTRCAAPALSVCPLLVLAPLVPSHTCRLNANSKCPLPPNCRRSLAVDIKDTGSEIQIVADVPGLSKDDIRVQVGGQAGGQAGRRAGARRY